MENLKIRHVVPKEREGTYYTVDFPVPENVRKITVSYKYPRLGGGTPNVIDLGLMDAQGKFLGWSGGAHPRVFVGEFQSSNGYIAQTIRPGNWKILVGAYHVQADGVPVDYEIAFEEKAPVWLFGDFHCHSTASDGAFDRHELGLRAKKMGLDFLAVADHNNVAENFAPPRIPGLTFVPAVEWTHYRGHMNFFGAQNPFENSFVANTDAEMRAVVAGAKARGALVSANHPKCNLCPYLWADEDCLDLIEVWNGPMRAINMRAIAWWTSFLRAGRRIPMVGGSDFHNSKGPVRLGHPTTAVYADSPAPEDILNALRAGKTYVTCAPDGPRIQIARTDGIVRIEAEALGRARLILVTQIGETDIGRAQKTEFPSDSPFAYVKAVLKIAGQEIVRAITNPVWE